MIDYCCFRLAETIFHFLCYVCARAVERQSGNPHLMRAARPRWETGGASRTHLLLLMAFVRGRVGPEKCISINIEIDSRLTRVHQNRAAIAADDSEQRYRRIVRFVAVRDVDREVEARFRSFRACKRDLEGTHGVISIRRAGSLDDSLSRAQVGHAQDANS